MQRSYKARFIPEYLRDKFYNDMLVRRGLLVNYLELTCFLNLI